MTRVPVLLPAFTSVLFTGAIFGFFYAWVCSTMWGLDQADSAVAIAAMQAMNASVRNAVFAPAFFGTPFILALAAFAAWKTNASGAAGAFLLGAVIYVAGAFAVTVLWNVPLNRELAGLLPPAEAGQAAAVWQAYSQPWQDFNLVRTLASGVALLCAATGLYRLGQAAKTSA